MSWGWFDVCVCSGDEDEDEDEDGPTPIPAPIVAGDAAYVDHVASALSRLPYYLAKLGGP